MTSLFPNARAADPVTSREAGAMLELSGVADSHRAQCMDAVQKHPGRTSAELAVCGVFDDWAADKRRHEVARRLPELRDRGQIENGPARPCEVTGNKALTWYPAGSADRDIKVLRRLYRDLDRMAKEPPVRAMALKAFLIGAAESLRDQDAAVDLFVLFWRCRTNDDAEAIMPEAMTWTKATGKRMKGGES